MGKCKYCQIENKKDCMPQFLICENREVIVFKAVLSAFIDPDKRTLTVDCEGDGMYSPFIEGAIKINYCPMCGRKL